MGEEAPTERLLAGRDFDVAVLAVSLGMVPFVASELVARYPAWRAMVEHVRTVATRSAQLWFTTSEADLGWTGPVGVTLSGFGETFDTWASMSHLLARESWPVDGAPASLAYLCSAMPDTDPAAGEDEVRDTLVRFLEGEVGSPWPGTRGPSGFPWEALWDQQGRVGRDRLDAQYVRANLDPSDRYVQSSSRLWQEPDGTGSHRTGQPRPGSKHQLNQLARKAKPRIANRLTRLFRVRAILWYVAVIKPHTFKRRSRCGRFRCLD